MRVLLIADETTTCPTAESLLKRGGFVVDVADSGDFGIETALAYGHDAVLVQGDLPDMTGEESIRALRAAGVTSPVLLLQAGDDAAGRARCLSAGADACLAAPYDRDELVANVTALVRRSRGHVQSVVVVADLTVRLDLRCAEIGQARVPLTPTEYRILEFLALRKGTTLTKEMFLNYLYGGMDEPDLKIVDVFVCKLRKKLAAASEGKNYIETVWGRGYALREAMAA